MRRFAFGMTYQADDGKIVFIPGGAARLRRELSKYSGTPDALGIRGEMLRMAAMMRGKLDSPLIAQEIIDAATAAFGEIAAVDAFVRERSPQLSPASHREASLKPSTQPSVKLIDVLIQ